MFLDKTRKNIIAKLYLQEITQIVLKTISNQESIISEYSFEHNVFPSFPELCLSIIVLYREEGSNNYIFEKISELYLENFSAKGTSVEELKNEFKSLNNSYKYFLNINKRLKGTEGRALLSGLANGVIEKIEIPNTGSIRKLIEDGINSFMLTVELGDDFLIKTAIDREKK